MWLACEKKLPTPARRLCYLYAFGGVYMDLDFTCLRPLHELLPPARVEGKAVLAFAVANGTAMGASHTKRRPATASPARNNQPHIAGHLA